MIQWEWDPVKAASNLRKHGVTFELAIKVFDDALATTFPDDHSDGDRLVTIGRPKSGSPVLLYVVHTEPVPLNGVALGRIISARPVTRAERRSYEEG